MGGGGGGFGISNLGPGSLYGRRAHRLQFLRAFSLKGAVGRTPWQGEGGLTYCFIFTVFSKKGLKARKGRGKNH